MGSKPKRKPSAPPPPSIAVGDVVDAQCRKCRQATQHIVVRKVGWTPTFVACQVCETSHDFKAPRSATSETELVEKSPAEEWQVQMAGTQTTRKPYDRTRHFEIGDFIQHSEFGDGVVVGRSSETVCEVAFERGTIKLVMATQSPRGDDEHRTGPGLNR